MVGGFEVTAECEGWGVEEVVTRRRSVWRAGGV